MVETRKHPTFRARFNRLRWPILVVGTALLLLTLLGTALQSSAAGYFFVLFFIALFVSVIFLIAHTNKLSRCPDCNSRLQYTKQSLARCTNCDTVFDIEIDLGGGA